LALKEAPALAPVNHLTVPCAILTASFFGSLSPCLPRQGSGSMATVTGVDPFLVPSQPGMAIEKRPAVPPATTT